MTDFIFLGSKITADGHEIKRHLLLGGKKAMTNVDILKSRDITLPTKVHIIKAIVCQIRIVLSFLSLHPSTAVQILLLIMRATPFLLRDSCSQ